MSPPNGTHQHKRTAPVWSELGNMGWKVTSHCQKTSVYILNTKRSTTKGIVLVIISFYGVPTSRKCSCHIRTSLTSLGIVEVHVFKMHHHNIGGLKYDALHYVLAARSRAGLRVLPMSRIQDEITLWISAEIITFINSKRKSIILFLFLNIMNK